MYYCKNCGQKYSVDEAVVCDRCGVAKGNGTNYCYNCGRPLLPDEQMCSTCGALTDTKAYVVNAGNASEQSNKSKVAAGVLGIIFGGLGVHNFYLGYTSKAVTQLALTIVGWLLSCFGIGVFLTVGISIWGLVEGILILADKINTDANGLPLSE